jgi:hypothetical protein
MLGPVSSICGHELTLFQVTGSCDFLSLETFSAKFTTCKFHAIGGAIGLYRSDDQEKVHKRTSQ